MKQIVRLFYNSKGIGDVLLLRFSNDEITHSRRNQDICQVFDEHNQLVGLNIFDASKKFQHLEDHGYFINDEIITEINSFLKQMNHQEIDFDQSNKFIVGRVISCVDHPKSEHLHICMVNTGGDEKQIVCGASNVAENELVVVANVGAVLPNGVLIEDSKVMGISSSGMLCSFKELQIPVERSGIILLDDSYKVGSEFTWKG